MQSDQLSVTALMSAYIRAHHAAHDAPKIFDDFLAATMLSPERHALITQGFVSGLNMKDPVRAVACPNEATAVQWMIQSMAGAGTVLCRAHYSEEKLTAAVSQGISQYLLLGAGLDTFAFRRGDIASQLQILEIDHPRMQAFKRSRIAELGWEMPAHVHAIPLDFTQHDIVDALAQSPFDSQAKSFISWLGVTMYLPRDVVHAALSALAALVPAGSMLVFDFLDEATFCPETAAPRVTEMLRMAEYAGEPMLTGFDPAKLAAELTEVGWHLQETVPPAEIQRRYFSARTDNYSACEHAHFAWAVVV